MPPGVRHDGNRWGVDSRDNWRPLSSEGASGHLTQTEFFSWEMRVQSSWIF